VSDLAGREIYVAPSATISCRRMKDPSPEIEPKWAHRNSRTMRTSVAREDSEDLIQRVSNVSRTAMRRLSLLPI
jgi:hypothetical protein